ncbi:hypothetical protein [Actinoplanes sp. DH11]|uniref:hypothetical protein n=1 Tax=Actinoplanes sp. DH11 TaxID=2857011 RepID=UPI001E395816|nr:hypothetical protein [Actinoplanes sp. DH11]
MSMSIGTSTPPTTRDTHAAWLRRREDDRPVSWRHDGHEGAIGAGARREPLNSLQAALA